MSRGIKRGSRKDLELRIKAASDHIQSLRLENEKNNHKMDVEQLLIQSLMRQLEEINKASQG